MRIPRFYISQPLETGQTLELPPDLFRHAIQVLRMKQDEPLILFNGEGGEYQGRLTEVAKRRANLSVIAYDPVDRESSLSVTLVQSIIKPDKMDFAIQKSVELGIKQFQPIISQRSVVRVGQDKLKKKHEHWQAVAISACEQSGRTRVPVILPTLTLDQWLNETQDVAPNLSPSASATDAVRIILAPGNHPRISELKIVKTQNTAFKLLIGPEGGFSNEETQYCIDKGINAVSMGPRILRAETASLAATALLQQHFGDI